MYDSKQKLILKVKGKSRREIVKREEKTLSVKLMRKISIYEIIRFKRKRIKCRQ
jgi:hypothetical protein